jgi:hypothetical protein
MKRGILTSDRHNGIQARDPCFATTVLASAPLINAFIRFTNRSLGCWTRLTKGQVSRYVPLLFGPSWGGQNIFADSPRFGEFNSRLGRWEFPVICSGIHCQGVDLPNRFNGQRRLRGGKIDKIPGSTGKTGNLTAASRHRTRLSPATRTRPTSGSAMVTGFRQETRVAKRIGATSSAGAWISG